MVHVYLRVSFEPLFPKLSSVTSFVAVVGDIYSIESDKRFKSCSWCPVGGPWLWQLGAGSHLLNQGLNLDCTTTLVLIPSGKEFQQRDGKQ